MNSMILEEGLYDFLESQIASYDEVIYLQTYSQKGNVKVDTRDRSAFVDCKRSPRVALSIFLLRDLQLWYKNKGTKLRLADSRIKVSFGKLKKILNLSNYGYRVFVSEITYNRLINII